MTILHVASLPSLVLLTFSWTVFAIGGHLPPFNQGTQLEKNQDKEHEMEAAVKYKKLVKF